MRTPGLVLFGVLALIGCRTQSGNESAVKDFPAGAQGRPAPEAVIFDLSNDPVSAKAIYDAYQSEETGANGGTTKSYSGDLYVYCGRQPASLPAGAQGFPGPGTFNCTAGAPMHFPPGAQGLPAPAMIGVTGKPAQALYTAMTVPELDSDG